MSVMDELGGLGQLAVYLMVFFILVIALSGFTSDVLNSNAHAGNEQGAVTNLSSELQVEGNAGLQTNLTNVFQGFQGSLTQGGGVTNTNIFLVLANGAYGAVVTLLSLPGIFISLITLGNESLLSSLGISLPILGALTSLVMIVFAILVGQALLARRT